MKKPGCIPEGEPCPNCKSIDRNKPNHDRADAVLLATYGWQKDQQMKVAA